MQRLSLPPHLEKRLQVTSLKKVSLDMAQMTPHRRRLPVKSYSKGVVRMRERQIFNKKMSETVGQKLESAIWQYLRRSVVCTGTWSAHLLLDSSTARRKTLEAAP